MSHTEVDGKWIAYPEIQMIDGELTKLEGSAALEKALETGNYKEFPAEQEAADYAEDGYKTEKFNKVARKNEAEARTPSLLEVPLEEQQTIGSAEDVEREPEVELQPDDPLYIEEDTEMETVLSGSNFSLSQLEDRGWVLSSDTPTSLFIKGFEGYLPEAKDDYGQMTNGFGTEADSPDETITLEVAQERLLARIKSDEKLVEEFGEKHGYNWTDNEKMALVSFIYNGGYDWLKEVSGLWEWERDEEGRKIPDSELIPSGKPKRYKEEIAEKMLLYINAGGQPLDGLIKRRQLEFDLFKGVFEI